MKRPRVKTYMALLLSLSLTAGAVLSVGNAQARIEGTTTVRNTVLQVRSDAMISDCLNVAGDQTVLLGAMASGETVDAAFTLQTREPVSCHLAWYTAEGLPIQTQVAFELLEGEGSLDENQLLTMEAGSKATVTLTITAEQTIGKDETADVQLFCGPLSGIFRVELTADPPQIAEPEDPTEPSEPEETTEPAEPSEPEDSGSVDVVLPGVPNDPSEITPDMAEIEMNTLSEFEQTFPLPVKVTVSGLAEELLIGLEGEEPLPAMTRYSTDGGVHWFVLYDEGYIVLEGGPEEDEEVRWLLMVDFSRAELWENVPLGLEALAYMLGEVSGIGVAQTTPRAGPERSDAVQILRGPRPDELQWFALLTVEEEPEPVDVPDPEIQEPILPTEGEDSEPSEPSDSLDQEETERAHFRIPLPVGWEEATELRYQAQILGTTGEGAIGYTPTEWDAQKLNAVVDSETGELIVYMGEIAPTAGTYRLTLECMYEGICFHQMQTTFFINYSIRSEVEYEEVPDNE